LNILKFGKTNLTIAFQTQKCKDLTLTHMWNLILSSSIHSSFHVLNSIVAISAQLES